MRCCPITEQDTHLFVMRNPENKTLYALMVTYVPASTKEDQYLDVEVYPGPQTEQEYRAQCMLAFIGWHRRTRRTANSMDVKAVENKDLEVMIHCWNDVFEKRHITEESRNVVPELAEIVWKDQHNFEKWYHSIADYSTIYE